MKSPSRNTIVENNLFRLLTVSCFSLATVLAILPVSATVITVQPGPTEGKDTYVDSRPYSNVPGIVPPYNTVNWGSLTYFQAGEADGGQGRVDTLIQFDLSTLPSVGVSKASLILTTLSDLAPSNVEPFLASAHRITSAWDENTVTWNSRPSFAPTPVASTTLDDIAGTPFEWDITSLYLDWKNGVFPNLGIYLTGDTILGEGVAFVSSENVNTPTLRPILRIETIPEPSTLLGILAVGTLRPLLKRRTNTTL